MNAESRIDYLCPKPAKGSRTKKELLGKTLSFAPGNDSVTVCDHCGESIDDHQRQSIPSKTDQRLSQAFRSKTLSEAVASAHKTIDYAAWSARIDRRSQGGR